MAWPPIIRSVLSRGGLVRDRLGRWAERRSEARRAGWVQAVRDEIERSGVGTGLHENGPPPAEAPKRKADVQGGERLEAGANRGEIEPGG